MPCATVTLLTTFQIRLPVRLTLPVRLKVELLTASPSVTSPPEEIAFAKVRVPPAVLLESEPPLRNNVPAPSARSLPIRTVPPCWVKPPCHAPLSAVKVSAPLPAMTMAPRSDAILPETTAEPGPAKVSARPVPKYVLPEFQSRVESEGHVGCQRGRLAGGGTEGEGAQSGGPSRCEGGGDTEVDCVCQHAGGSVVEESGAIQCERAGSQRAAHQRAGRHESVGAKHHRTGIELRPAGEGAAAGVDVRRAEPLFTSEEVPAITPAPLRV
jgi:hypothetical protein